MSYSINLRISRQPIRLSLLKPYLQFSTFMKNLLLLLFLPSFAFSQANSKYLQVGPALHINKSTSMIGGAIGFGMFSKNASIGIGLEAYSHDKKSIIPIYADFKYYFKSNKIKFFATLQPGYNITSRSTTFTDGSKKEESGGLFAASGAGVLKEFKAMSFGIQLRYSIFTSKTHFIYPYNDVFEKKSPGFFGINLFAQF